MLRMPIVDAWQSVGSSVTSSGASVAIRRSISHQCLISTSIGRRTRDLREHLASTRLGPQVGVGIDGRPAITHQAVAAGKRLQHEPAWQAAVEFDQVVISRRLLTDNLQPLDEVHRQYDVIFQHNRPRPGLIRDALQGLQVAEVAAHFRGG